MTVAEALSQGCPVLITDKVNIYSSVVDGGAGFVESDTFDGTVALMERWCSLSKPEESERAFLRANRSPVPGVLHSGRRFSSFSGGSQGPRSSRITDRYLSRELLGNCQCSHQWKPVTFPLYGRVHSQSASIVESRTARFMVDLLLSFLQTPPQCCTSLPRLSFEAFWSKRSPNGPPVSQMQDLAPWRLLWDPIVALPTMSIAITLHQLSSKSLRSCRNTVTYVLQAMTSTIGRFPDFEPHSYRTQVRVAARAYVGPGVTVRCGRRSRR